jgi:putative hydrolase of HD superfamily
MRWLRKLTEIVVTLDNIPRVGWVQRGVPMICAETIARHTLLTSLIGLVICRLYKMLCGNVDCDKMLTMCLLHDLPEANIGNIAGHVRKVIDLRKVEVTELETQLQELEPQLRNSLGMLYLEYRSGTSIEAILTTLADKLATLAMACYYYEEGKPRVRDLIRYYVDKVREVLMKIPCREFVTRINEIVEEAEREA